MVMHDYGMVIHDCDIVINYRDMVIHDCDVVIHYRDYDCVIW